MKFKRLIYIFLILISVVSIILSFGPLEIEEYERSQLKESPLNGGSFFYYDFSSVNAFVINKQLSNSTIAASNNGLMELRIVDSSVKVHIVNDIYIAGMFNYIQNSCYNLTTNSEFVKILLNNENLNKGSVVKINDQLIGNVLGQSRRSEQISFNGQNLTLKNYANENGVFITTSVSLINFNSTGVPQQYLNGGTLSSPNEIIYGQTSGTNVLVFMQNSGNSGFLDTLYSSSNTSLEKVYGFSISLISSNVAISSLDYIYYMGLYLPLEIVIWAVSAIYFLFLYRRVKSKMNNDRKK